METTGRVFRWACGFEQVLERIWSTKELTGKGGMVVRGAEADELM